MDLSKASLNIFRFYNGDQFSQGLISKAAAIL